MDGIALAQHGMDNTRSLKAVAQKAGLGLDSDQARWAIREIKCFLESYRKWVHSLVLFGSYALGRAGRHSDVDFLVLLKNGEKVAWSSGMMVGSKHFFAGPIPNGLRRRECLRQ